MRRFMVTGGFGAVRAIAAGMASAMALACSDASDTRRAIPSDTGADNGTAGEGAGQAPAPGAAGTAAAGGAPPAMAGTGGAAHPPDPGPDVPARLPPCVDDPRDVVLIGDSYIDWVTHTFIADLAAESGQQWRSYAVGGTSLATGGLGSIPPQLDAAIADNPNIKVVVMTGGGNDILVPDTVMFPQGGQCTHTPDAPMIEDCRRIVQAALEAAEQMMLTGANAGISDVVYFFYPHIPGGGLISGPHPNAILDYALPLARELCETAYERTGGRARCHFIDMVPVFAGKTGLFADLLSEAGDGVHPNSDGSKVMAAEVWRVMQEACLAQPSGSGCCE